ncbi:hypothetical protein HDU84_002037 [Entophlyctis sp. JEL0112]|nr:hypothetical protein HDU84_002037 [Entophlyctis sp. JEL0112]
MLPAGSADNRALLLTTRALAIAAAYCLLHALLDLLWARALARRRALSNSDRISLAEKVASSLNALFIAAAAFHNAFVLDLFSPAAVPIANVHSPCSSPMISLLSIYPFSPLQVPAGSLRSFFHYDWVLPAYVGYSIYDCITMYFQGDNHWSMWVHHLVGIYGAIGNMKVQKLAVLSNFAMLTEVTAFCVNILWYVETLTPNRQRLPPPEPSITSTLGDTKSNDEGNDSETSPPVSPNPAAASSTTTQQTKKSGKNRKKPAKPAPTPLLLALQTLRTVSFLVFRVTAVPYSLYVVSRTGSLVDMFAAVWRGCTTRECARGWSVDRVLLISALVVQILFGLLNFVWTYVAVKVLAREVRTYLRIRGRKTGVDAGSKAKED